MEKDEKERILKNAVVVAQMHGFDVNRWFREKLNLPPSPNFHATIHAIMNMGYEDFLLNHREFIKALEPSAQFCTKCRSLCTLDISRQPVGLVCKDCRTEITWLDNWKAFAREFYISDDPWQFMKDYLVQAGVMRKRRRPVRQAVALTVGR